MAFRKAYCCVKIDDHYKKKTKKYSNVLDG